MKSSFSNNFNDNDADEIDKRYKNTTMSSGEITRNVRSEIIRNADNSVGATTSHSNGNVIGAYETSGGNAYRTANELILKCEELVSDVERYRLKDLIYYENNVNLSKSLRNIAEETLNNFLIAKCSLFGIKEISNKEKTLSTDCEYAYVLENILDYLTQYPTFCDKLAVKCNV